MFIHVSLLQSGPGQGGVQHSTKCTNSKKQQTQHTLHTLHKRAGDMDNPAGLTHKVYSKAGPHLCAALTLLMLYSTLAENVTQTGTARKQTDNKQITSRYQTAGKSTPKG